MTDSAQERAVIYARVSDDDVSKGQATLEEKAERASISIRAQVTEGEALCATAGYLVAETLADDGVSGYDTAAYRESFRKLLRLIAGGHVDVIVCRHIDRLGRNDADNSAIRHAAARTGVDIHPTSGGRLNMSRSGDKLTLQMQQNIAEYESAVKSERLASVNAQRRAEGVLRSTHKAFGWQWEKGKPERSMLADPVEAELVRELYARVIGNGSPYTVKGEPRTAEDAGASLYEIAADWTARGIPTVRGAAWSIVALRAILMRPSNARRVRDGKGWDYLPDVRGAWDALVDDETYRRAREILTSPSRRTNAGRKSRHLVSGIAKCGHPGCVGVLRPSSVDDKQGGRMPIYRCVRKLDRPSDPGVKHVSARADTLDTEARRHVIAAFVHGPASLFPDAGGTSADDIYAALDDISRARRDVLALVTDGLATRAEAASQLATMRAREERLRADLDAATASATASMRLTDLRAGVWGAGKRVSIKAGAEYARTLGERFDALPIESRRALVRHLLDITVMPLSPGVYGSRRWRIVHKVVTSLNAPERIEDADEQPPQRAMSALSGPLDMSR
ncbi:recombinase family protein [Microbacterium sp. NPDC089318]